ncbi:MAG: hypothetical protein V4543_08205 [Bacteroidota bacterium]
MSILKKPAPKQNDAANEKHSNNPNHSTPGNNRSDAMDANHTGTKGGSERFKK